jgi:hypothetical protein
MKKITLYAALASIFFLNVASMCSSDDDSSSSTDFTPIINTVSQGTWRVTSFIDSDVDETNHFSGYDFTFISSNGKLIASNTANTYNGLWSVTKDDSNDDNPSNDIDFNISFSSPANFVDLTDDWNIISRTDTKIQLISVSGGGGGTDYLTFEKN